MSDFTPGVERAKAAGYNIEVRPYVGTGEEQVQESLTVIATKIRNGRLDPDVRGWVGDVLKAAGDPKGRAAKVQALLDAFRQATIYVSDPVGAEYIVAAGTTMCLRPGLCVRARDCDDGVVAVGSAVMAAGIPVIVVKQNFGPGKQEHVLVEALMEDGSWLPADPSTNLAAGDKVPAVHEERLDPMDMVGSAGTSGPEIVSLGGIPASEWPRKSHGHWTVRKDGKWWEDHPGVGWVPVGAGDACCASCAAKDAKGAGTTSAQGNPPYPAPKGKQWVWGRGCTEPGGGIVPGWGLIDAPASSRGTGSDGDESGCSACEAWAKRNAADIEAMGVSGPKTSRPVPRYSIRGLFLRGGLGLGADLPGTTVLANPLPIRPTSGSVGVAGVAAVALGLAFVGGVAWSLGQESACVEAPRRRRRAA